jgi:exonuclease SbcC
VRPIRLTVQGFAAFRDRVEVDFEDVDFFALVGPTGSGKSSIIDAMCFALYGNVPRYEDQRRVGFAIAIQSLEARVSLVFEVGGERYVAARVVRRTSQGGATTREARLERYIDSEATETRASGPREVNEAVEQVLGLPFEHFTKCVVLPQGEFARFLHDRPTDRQELLVRLLDLGRYARMGSKARERATQADATARLCEQRLESLADATDAAKVKAQARLAALKDLRAQVERARIKLTELERSIETLTTTATAANDFATRLAIVGVPPEVTALAEQLQAATEERRRQQEDLQEAEAALAKLEQAAGEQRHVDRSRRRSRHTPNWGDAANSSSARAKSSSERRTKSGASTRSGRKPTRPSRQPGPGCMTQSGSTAPMRSPRPSSLASRVLSAFIRSSSCQLSAHRQRLPPRERRFKGPRWRSPRLLRSMPTRRRRGPGPKAPSPPSRNGGRNSTASWPGILMPTILTA